MALTLKIFFLMNTEDLSSIECPVIFTIKLIGNKWKLLILRALFLGTCRFNQLQKELGDISQKVLT